MKSWADMLTELSKTKTQLEISAETGISQSFLSQVKNGRRKKIGYDIGVKLKCCYEQTMSEKQKNASGH